ncbi:MAG: TIGR04211 family SH3 domain-containing protein [Gammaproteobacteria bacterium]|nr:TIGR04211 family SH3 domain-containing protein [Gammaproteobacteria bacterium]
MHPISSKFLTRALLFFVCFTCLSVIQAETAYVDDRLRVGVRKEPGNKLAPHAIVVTGMKLEILEEDEDGNFIRIKTDSGIEGWIKKSYTTSERPAKDLLAELRKSYNELKTQKKQIPSGDSVNDDNEQFISLQNQNTELRKELDKLNKQITKISSDKTGAIQIKELKNQNEMLEKQIEEMTSSSDIQESPSTGIDQYNTSWLSSITINVLMILLGFSAGFLWFRRQMIRRLGGAEN